MVPPTSSSVFESAPQKDFYTLDFPGFVFSATTAVIEEMIARYADDQLTSLILFISFYSSDFSVCAECRDLMTTVSNLSDRLTFNSLFITNFLFLFHAD
jgi:hypothetical protein